MIELKKSEVEPAEGAVEIPIFSVPVLGEDGKEVEKIFSIPDKVRPGVAMQYLFIARTMGIGIAESWLGEALLGAEGYQALINFPDLTQEQSDAIISSARAVVFGEVRPKETKNGRPSRTAAPRKRTSSTKRVNGS
jgi:hypothetical protein